SFSVLRRLANAAASGLSGQSIPTNHPRSTSRPARSASRARSHCPLRERRRGSGAPSTRTSNGPNRQMTSETGVVEQSDTVAALDYRYLAYMGRGSPSCPTFPRASPPRDAGLATLPPTLSLLRCPHRRHGATVE